MKTIVFEPLPGSHIKAVCESASTMSRDKNCFVEFSFNEVLLTASPDSTGESLVSSWEAENERRANTPEAIARRERYKKQRTIECAEKQRRLDAFLAVLPAIASNTDALMTALHTYTEDADDIDVTNHCREVAEILKVNGFTENDLVGEPPESFKTRPRIARWIVGQVINCASKGMGPHPIAVKFIDEYFSLSQS